MSRQTSGPAVRADAVESGANCASETRDEVRVPGDVPRTPPSVHPACHDVPRQPRETRVTQGHVSTACLELPVPYRDLREFIAEVDALGALRRIDGADPRFEIGGITEVAAGLADCPALLFDRINGFPPGVRVFTNATTNVQRAALALGIDPRLPPL